MYKHKFLTILILFTLFLGIIAKPILIKADSGFDSSYDSGGSSSSSSSSSDWSSSSSDYSSSGGGSISTTGFVIIIIIIIIGAIISPISNGIENVSNHLLSQIVHTLFGTTKIRLIVVTLIAIFLLPTLTTVPISFIAGLLSYLFIMGYNISILKKGPKIKDLPPKLTDEEIHSKLPSLNIKEFNDKVFNIYNDVQIAWMNYDIDSIKNLLSDEMYNMYKMQIETLKIKGERNIMKNIKYINSYITSIENVNDITTINVILQVTCYDYIIDNKQKVIRGSKFTKLHYTYFLKFTKKNIEKHIDICPNCGAKINDNSSRCEYCNSVIVDNENDWIMTKKQMITQTKL